MTRFYSITEIAEIYNVSQKTIRRQIANDKLIAYRVGNQWRIDEKDLESWVKGYNESDTKQLDALREFTQYNLFGEPVRLPGRVSKNHKKLDIINWVDISDYWGETPAKKYSYIDLFAGAGGLSLGLEMAGFVGILAVEIMEQAVATYKRNFKHPVIPVIDNDIREFKTKQDVYELVNKNLGNDSLDMICGGFPCQGFSLSGYRVVEDERNSLYREMIEIIGELRPKFVIMENVVGLRSMLHGKVEEKIINDLQQLDYRINITVLNSADYEVPQIRNRVIFIANNIGRMNFHPSPLLTPEYYKTTREAIGGLIDHPNDPAFNHEMARHSPEMRERLMRVPEGKSLYDNYSDAWKKCPWNEPSCTIKENHGGVNIHPRLPRVLTVREMARLQSFPDDFIFCGARKWQMVQVGNAVPPLLGKAIGLAVRKSLEQK
ncbi:hypothetical protein ES703_28301 [subsurface metagenome]